MAKIIRLTRTELRKIINEMFRKKRETRLFEAMGSTTLNQITIDDLEQLAPEALSSIEQPEQPETEDLNMMWIMSSKPELVHPGTEEQSYTDEEWTETNEPELASWLSEEWDQHAVDGVVILCGSLDDEYGWFWSNGLQKWITYAF